jgi:predicted ArsR family transcriptional regulator
MPPEQNPEDDEHRALGPDERPNTRSRIVSLLRRGSHTVNDLADALGMTGNAIRAHLTILERDGLVRPSGKRPGVRKPLVTYGLTPQAERLFPRPYGAVLGRVLDVLKEQTNPAALDELVRSVGRRIALDYRTTLPTGRPADHVDRALALLKEFGGFCEREDTNGTTVLACSDCPLAAVAEGRPEVCVLMEAVLTEATGLPVRQRCGTRPTPQCRFEIDGAG